MKDRGQGLALSQMIKSFFFSWFMNIGYVESWAWTEYVTKKTDGWRHFQKLGLWRLFGFCGSGCSLFLIYLLFSANSGTQSSYLIRFLLLPLIRSVLSNMYEMEQLLQKTEDINWTVVRPPGLKNLPATGKSRQIASWVGGVNREWRSLIQWKLSDLVWSILP